MSQENIDLVQRALEAYRARDIETLQALLDADVEWKQVEELVPAHGWEAVAEALGRWEENWDELDTEAEELIDAGDHVVAGIRFRGRGGVSGVPVEQVSYLVFTVLAGKITRMHEYGPAARTEALQAVGLPE
jgi:ketosteroid isomerase-like protein